jgi:hypothetical protein
MACCRCLRASNIAQAITLDTAALARVASPAYFPGSSDGGLIPVCYVSGTIAPGQFAGGTSQTIPSSGIFRVGSTRRSAERVAVYSTRHSSARISRKFLKPEDCWFRHGVSQFTTRKLLKVNSHLLSLDKRRLFGILGNMQIGIHTSSISSSSQTGSWARLCHSLALCEL